MKFIQIMNNLNIIIDRLNAMRIKAVREHGKWILQTEPNALNVFSILDKVVTVPLELLVYYRDLWVNPTMRQSEHDTEERIKVISNSCFISCLSAVEYFMKDCLRKTIDGPMLPWYKKMRKEKKHISFYGIVKESLEQCIISESDFNMLDGLRLLRNALVHNNGISDFNNEWDIDGIMVKFKKDSPIRYKLWAISGLIETINQQTERWARGYLSQHSIQ